MSPITVEPQKSGYPTVTVSEAPDETDGDDDVWTVDRSALTVVDDLVPRLAMAGYRFVGATGRAAGPRGADGNQVLRFARRNPKKLKQHQEDKVTAEKDREEQARRQSGQQQGENINTEQGYPVDRRQFDPDPRTQAEPPGGRDPVTDQLADDPPEARDKGPFEPPPQPGRETPADETMTPEEAEEKGEEQTRARQATSERRAADLAPEKPADKAGDKPKR